MINCIAVDDEPLALDLLEDNIRQVPFLRLAARCKNAFEAMEALQQEKIDLVFIDIQMPGMTGTDFIASLPHKPFVIFITAYEKYAHKGYELDAIDYLVKPVPFVRFLKAVNKARDYSRLTKQDAGTPKNDYIFINSEYSLVKVRFADIQYIEGLKDYIKLYLDQQPRPLLTRMNLKAVEDLLPKETFIRVHKSFIVSMGKVDSIRRNRIRIGAAEIPGRRLHISSFHPHIPPARLFGFLLPATRRNFVRLVLKRTNACVYSAPFFSSHFSVSPGRRYLRNTRIPTASASINSMPARWTR